MPDVGNGFFVHPYEDVINGIKGEQPTRLVGATEDSVVVFGSDGGGSLFALSQTRRTIYRLLDGPVVGSTYETDDKDAVAVGRELCEFLGLSTRTAHGCSSCQLTIRNGFIWPLRQPRSLARYGSCRTWFRHPRSGADIYWREQTVRSWRRSACRLASSTSRGELGRRAELDRQPEWSGQDADLPIGQALSLAQQVPQDGDDWVPIGWRDLHGYAQHTSTVEELWMGVAPELRPWLWSDDSRVR